MLEISRTDVLADELQDWGSDRFLKLPVEAYLKLLKVGGETAWDGLVRPQLALINALNSPHYRFICAALSRRLGKTFISNVCGQLVALVPNSSVLIMSPNYTLSTISFELQRSFINQFDLEVSRDNVKDKVIELSNASTIRMGSLSTVDSCVGRSYDLIIFDEAALGSDGEEAFNVSLRPTLDKPGSKAVFISTPRGKSNWFSRFYNRGFSADYRSWCSIHADYTENPRMLESDVLEARSGMSKAHFEQEYLASFNTYEGQIYARSKIVEEPYEAVAGDEVFAGLDPGYRDSTALVVCVYSPARDCYHIVAEYERDQLSTAEHAANFNEMLATWGWDPLFIDSAAAQFAADLAYQYDISTVKANKSVLEGIAFVQNIIESNKLRVDPNCTKTLEMFDQYQWDPRESLTREKPKHDGYSHLADAVRYALYNYKI